MFYKNGLYLRFSVKPAAVGSK